MPNSNGWGDGASNNNIGWGQGAINGVGWGSVYSVSNAGLTDIIGSGTPPASPPVNSILPVISGTAVVGSTLTTTDGTWTNSPTSFAYQWRRGVTNIGTNSQTYVLVQADAGENITCVVTATNGAGSTPATSNSLLIFDFDANAFFNRVTAASGTLTLLEQTATNTLVVQMKTDGIFTLMKAIYPMVGSSAAACAQNLKANTFTGSFSSGWTFASTGVTGNGTSAFMNSGFVPSTNGLTYNNNHISFYSRTSAQSGATQFYEMGSGNASGSDNLALFIRRNTNAGGYDSGNFTINRASFTNTNGNGFYCGTAPTTTSKYFKNGTSQVTKALTNSAISTINIYIGGFNENNTTVYFSSRQCAFCSIGDGLTDIQASNFYTAVQAFQTSLSRQV